MPNFNLTLTTEEIKTLQGLLEDFLSQPYQADNRVDFPTETELLTKITLVQLVDDGCMSKHEEAYTRDANYPRPDENGPAY